MEEALKSAIGGETSDAVLRTVSDKPVWYLKPLPLSQAHPSHRTPTPSARIGPPPSLTTSALATISAHFHSYDPDSLVGLPTEHIRRIVRQVRRDRFYADVDDGSMVLRPDEATLWAYHVLADPEGAESSLTLGLQPRTTIKHLVPNPALESLDHPFIALPKLYRAVQASSPFVLLTSLRFDGVDGGLNDASVMALRYATNLTALWMTACEVSDSGVRLLASALGLGRGEENTGMWRLRAWYLRGCRKVGDRSMRSFARWPGLVTLDVRDTSCTSAGIEIFNSTTRSLYSNRVAEMQPVNSDLRPIFSHRCPPAIILSHLSATLLHPPRPHRSKPPHRSLNIVPSHMPLPANCLPEPTVAHVRPTVSSSAYTSVAFRPGMGTIYGTDVNHIADERAAYRKSVRDALTFQAVEDGLMEDPWEAARREEAEWRSKSKKQRDAIYRREEAALANLKRGYRDLKAEEEERERKRRGPAVGVIRLDEGDDDEAVLGEEECMLVRVAQEGWEDLTWDLAGLASQSQTQAQARGGASQKASTSSQRKGNLGDMLDSVSASSSATAAYRPFSPFAPSQCRAHHDDDDSAASALTPSQSQATATMPKPARPNPFRSASSASQTSPFGVKPLGSSQVSANAPSSSPSSQSADDPLAFVSAGQKRRFGGGDADAGARRRGMKMFSGPKA